VEGPQLIDAHANQKDNKPLVDAGGEAAGEDLWHKQSRCQNSPVGAIEISGKKGIPD